MLFSISEMNALRFSFSPPCLYLIHEYNRKKMVFFFTLLLAVLIFFASDPFHFFIFSPSRASSGACWSEFMALSSMFFSSSFSFYPKSLIRFSFDRVFVWIHVFLLALRMFGILVVSAELTEEFKVFWAASLLCTIRFYKMLYKKNICASVILHRPLLSPAAAEQIYFPGECQCEFCIIDTATSNLTAPDPLSPPEGYWVFDLGSVSIWAPAEKENCKEVMPCCFQYPQRAGKFRLHSGFWEI